MQCSVYYRVWTECIDAGASPYTNKNANPNTVHGTGNNNNNILMPTHFRVAGAGAGVHSCGILRRLEWRWGVVSYG